MVNIDISINLIAYIYIYIHDKSIIKFAVINFI